ncbi:hypothetical protein QVD17_35541 [Tagetes erecta]|uniref:Uncharacterized protein n=1 Tax=Tagetes erecta TaxID=13708 RepID=A0AAD8NF77_TARER|nr:hypothetical protein QVD17_35541 [Tagetes erecta]
MKLIRRVEHGGDSTQLNSKLVKNQLVVGPIPPPPTTVHHHLRPPYLSLSDTHVYIYTHPYVYIHLSVHIQESFSLK